MAMALARTSAFALAAALAALLIPADAHAAGAGSCARMPASTGNVIDVVPAQAGQLAGIVSNAPAGATIRLADGTYSVGTLTVRSPGVTCARLPAIRAA
jgi:hypothetical protein